MAYDLVFSSWRLRGSFDTGVWYGFVPFYIFAGPGLALIWQHGDFELGLGTRYVVAPIDSFQLTLMSGARF